MNNIDKRYQELLQDILDNGVTKGDRTGTGTISVFSRQIRHKMSEGFPLLTTKKMHWKSIVTELLWFLRGDTNIKFLLDYDCHIWDGDAYKNYSKRIENVINGYKSGDIMGMQPHMEKWYSDSDKLIPLTKEEFIHNIKTNHEFAEEWGELGPIYGKQWRDWNNYTVKPGLVSLGNGLYNENYWDIDKPIDQIANLISELKTNPDSRRLMVSAWNVGELDQMVLPPCHYGFQVYTRELSWEERRGMFQKHIDGILTEEWADQIGFPKRAISLMWNQRSVDTFLGLPFNIASYGLLLEIIAREVNMIPDELIGNLGDVHLYTNHIEQAKEQIGRKYTADERVEMLKNAMGEDKYNEAVEDLMPFAGGLSEHYEYHKIPYHSREPYKLPTVEITERNWYQHEKVKEHLGPKTFNQKILSYRPDCFELINYQSHGKIKAPLSN